MRKAGLAGAEGAGPLTHVLGWPTKTRAVEPYITQNEGVKLME